MIRSFLVLLILVVGCNSDDINCEAVLCIGTPSLVLNFSDQESGELYFEDQDISMNPEGLSLRLASTNELLVFGQSYGFSDAQELIIYLYQEPIVVTLEDEFETTISADVVSVQTDGCCSPRALDNIELSEGSFDVETDSFLYRLFISI